MDDKFTNDPEFEVKEELRKKRKEIGSFEGLTAFLKDVTNNYNVGYGSSVRAIGQAILATAEYLAREFGITGFQASCITWEFMSGWTHIGDIVGAKILDYDKMLYPQYGYQFEKVISPTHWDNLQKAAKELLETNPYNACPEVVAHWQSIVDGNIPFGYSVKDD